jgi:adenosylcobinamide-phosphate synthase
MPDLISGVNSMGVHPFLLATLLVTLACGLDRLVGDPRWCLHPVVVMGWLITALRRSAEAWAGDNPWKLRLAGSLITLLLVGGSAMAGWSLEWWARHGPLPQRLPALAVLLIGLASALAGRSLEQAVREVLAALPDLGEARRRLAWIVGRDTAELDAPEILRATAETASENAVDGLFAPLFWMVVGAAVGHPLALAWAFKAASTLDSMLGYRRGRLEWLGTAGARLDDLLTWLPCRLVALGLPLVAGRGPVGCLRLFRLALADGAPDPSPNAGVSQAAYAHAVGVQLGGWNRYGHQRKAKPLLAQGWPAPTAASVEQMLQLSTRLQVVWLAVALLLAASAQ